MQLEGKSVLITGAGSGIGRAIAAAASRRGAILTLIGRRPDALEETRAHLAHPDMARLIACDITQATDRTRLKTVMTDEVGRLDVLVNNAGIVTVGPIERLLDEEIRAVIETNLVAPMALTRDLIRLLEAGAPSRVVNVGSMFGDIAYPLFAAYSASKFGLRGWSDALRRELEPMKVGVTYVAPRATRTAAATRFESLIEPFGMTLDDPAKVGETIVRGIERDARVIYPLGPERLFVLVQRLFPGLVDMVATNQVKAIT